MFFTKFPSTKLQDVNLDWLLKKICKLRGGTRNQVLAKASDADFDFKWITGGGGGGTSDYNDLENQPQINSITLVGDQSASDLGLLGTAALTPYRTAADQDTIDAGKQAKITASGMLKGDGDGGVTAATPGTDYLAPAALGSYRTAAAQDDIDAGKQAKITASGLLKGDGDGGVTAATAGTDYLAPAALNSYRTAANQDVIDAAQNTNIASRAKADELAIVITGARPSMVVAAGQYVIVRDSMITGITAGLYRAVNALSPSTDVTAADLTTVGDGGLNSFSALLDGAFKNITATVTGSAAAGENAWTYVPVTIPTGYRMIAVNSLRFMGTDATYIVLRGFEVDNANSRVTLFCKNTASSVTINYNAVIRITCVKSNLF